MRPVLIPTFAALMLAPLALAACNAPKPPEAPAAPAAPAPPAAPAAVVLPTGFSLTGPQAGATTASPLTVSGVAPANWYVEAIFGAQLLAADGSVLAEAPAQAQAEGMPGQPVPFKAVLTYSVTAAQAGTVVLTQDQAGEDQPTPQEVRIPVMLVPAG